MFKKLLTGAAILKDWWEDGGQPVPKNQSQARADICAGKASGIPCAYNKPGFVPIESAAEFIRHQIERKNKLKLAVDGEEKLHTCSICWCSLPLKIHTPIEHILVHTDIETLKEFADKKPECWINLEQQNPA